MYICPKLNVTTNKVSMLSIKRTLFAFVKSM